MSINPTGCDGSEGEVNRGIKQTDLFRVVANFVSTNSPGAVPNGNRIILRPSHWELIAISFPGFSAEDCEVKWNICFTGYFWYRLEHGVVFCLESVANRRSTRNKSRGRRRLRTRITKTRAI